MNDQKITTALLTITVLLLVGGGILFIKNASKQHGTQGVDAARASSAGMLAVSIQTVTDQKGELGSLENTWPGEIISFGDIQVQPRREGTIVEWNVNIGQRVRVGQVIARLSAPPAMPELTSMLAEQAKMVTEARVDAKAQISFSEKKRQQLIALLSAVEKTKIAYSGTLDGTQIASNSSVSAVEAVVQARNASSINQDKIRTVLEQAINKELQLLSGNVDFITSYKITNNQVLNLKEPIGRLNLGTRSTFTAALINAAREIINDNSDLEMVGAEYFQAVSKMVAATYAGDEISDDQLMEIRKMVSMDQMAFLDAVGDYQISKSEVAKMETEYKLLLSEKETDYAMQQKDIAEQIAMLERDIAMSNGRVQAAEASYGTVAGSINGGLAIVSPADGIVSSIMKKNGDFVEPGMAVASINTGRKTDRFVRFTIPSNIRLPKPGSELVIVRPGFIKESHKVKLIGVGTALDVNGSYMADAKFIDDVDWPVNVSVRVMPSGSASSTLFVNVGALEWSDSGAALWMLQGDNTITKRSIKTGRTLGEKIEVYEGVRLGENYVGKIISGLREGVKVTEGENIATSAPSTEDAHGHNE